MLYFFVALAAVSLGYYVAWPLIQGPAQSPEDESSEQVALSTAPAAIEAEQVRLNALLTEMDFDHSIGKTTDADWQSARVAVEQQLQRLTQFHSAPGLQARERDLELEVHIARARYRLRRLASPTV